MIRLKNLKNESIKMEVTRVPLSNTRKASEPALIDDLDKPGEKIPDPRLLTEMDKLVLRADKITEFEGGEDKEYNEEQGEYLYKTLGTVEDGGYSYQGGPKITNTNSLIEVDKEGKEIKDNLFKKYRLPQSPAVMQNIQRVEVEEKE